MMSAESAEIREQFEQCLTEYVYSNREGELQEAYQCGRLALQAGESALDMVERYHIILRDLIQEMPEGESVDSILTRGAEFLSEALATFEMQQRGFREITRTLQDKNKTLQDEIEKRKQAEEDLEGARDFYHAILENSQDGIAVIDLDEERILYRNEALTQSLGYSGNELEDYQMGELIHDEDRKILDDLIEKAGENLNRSFESVVRAQHKNGTWRTLDVRVRSFRDHTGKVRFITNSRDITEKHQMREFYETILNNSLDGISVLDLENEEVIFRSPAVAEILGYDAEELDNIEATDLVHPDDEEKMYRMLEQAGENPGESKQEDLRYRHKDGSWHVLETRVRTFIDQDSKTKYIANSRDITEKHRYRKEADEKQQELEEAQRIAHIGNWRWEVEENDLIWSEEVYRIFGYEPDEIELRYELYLQMIHEDDREHVNNTVEKAFQENDSFDYEHRLVRPGGEVRWAYCKGEVTRNAEGDPVRFRGICRDITDQKEYERQLRQKQHELEEAQRIAHIGNWRWELQGDRELYWSDELFRLYGYEPGGLDLNYENYIQLQHPDDRDYVRSVIKKAIEERGSYEYEHRVNWPNGETHILFGRGKVVTDDKGEPVRIVGTCQDITKQREYEKKLKNYSKRLRQLSARLEQTREEERIRMAREIHDELGQTLTVLKMDLGMLESQFAKKGDEGNLPVELVDAKKTVDTVLDSVKRIVTDLRPEILDNLGLGEAVDWQAEKFEKRTGIDVNVTTELNGKELNDKTATAVFRVYQEALTNVAKHAEAETVTVEFYQNDSELVLSIQDDGKGITDEDIERTASLGILSMQERIHSVTGNLTIDGIPGEGTKVTVTVPMETNSKQETRDDNNGD